MVAYNTLEQSLSDVGVTLIDVNQHDDQYGKNVMVVVVVGNDQNIQALVIAALRRNFTAISELSNNISTKRIKGVKDYYFTGRYRTLISERVDISAPTADVELEITEPAAVETINDSAPAEPAVTTRKPAAKRKGR